MKNRQLFYSHNDSGAVPQHNPCKTKPPELLIERTHDNKERLIEGLDFRIVRLDRSNVCGNKKNVKKEGKEESEKLFQGMLQLLGDNFPASEIENEAQYRRYFYDRYAASWFVEIAVDNAGKVIGASLYSYCREVNLVMYNIVAVDNEYRQRGIASALVSKMVESSNKRAIEVVGSPALYVMGEIEQPDSSFTGEEGRIRNEVRPPFHDNVSKIRAIRLPDGTPLIYLLPIMATDQEREEVAKAGKPFKPEPLMFCLKPLTKPEGEGISSKEAAKLIIWFYKDYLEAECSDVKREEVNELLAGTLAKLATNADEKTIKALLDGGRKNDAKIIDIIPEAQLRFVKISETAI